ncbi:MAG: hypothetical protein MJY78_04200 [Fibrobacter sp.]|nr:hypothetical protein [Fibrobacter sp.]
MNNLEESFSRFDDKTTHRYFVITHVDSNDDVLVVNRSTYHGLPSEETTCILNPGDHSSVEHTSYIPYKRAKIEKYSLIPSNRLERDVSLDLYERMREGAKMSDFIPYECYRFIMCH